MRVPRTAALYMRMSTERQDYSISHQQAALEAYALEREMEIVRVYQDEGKSGLEIKSRPGLLTLIEDVQAGRASFAVVLVYDVSRWGRFQDVDESAYYEYTCRRAGVQVEYCLEHFPNEEAPLANLLKGIKRAMAAEYSRELSGKVFRAQCRLTEIGFKQGGTAGYGLRRAVVDKTGQIKRVLQYGDRKAFTTDRVVFVLGPAHEAEIVREIYRLYLDEKLTQTAIAHHLNRAGVPSESGRPWSVGLVKTILTNEKYVGKMIFNRGSCKLKTPRVINAKADWVVRPDAFAAIVPPEIFDRAQQERVKRATNPTNDELLQILRDTYAKHGAVNARLLSAEKLPGAKLYFTRFGNLVNAYKLAGIPRSRFLISGETKHIVHQAFDRMFAEVQRLAAKAGAAVVPGRAKGLLVLNGLITVRVTAQRRHNEWGRYGWFIRLDQQPAVDYILCAQLNQDNASIMGYYLFPIAELEQRTLITITPNSTVFERYKYATLHEIFGLRAE